ncbi:AAA family ATPase [Ensifer adhaerens]|uniref:AAA family ATPase n=1 Tax=Ensifer adhaerens TaxID=106592 RepID=UPI001177E651|nr:AAA family ATPase [Ensifer adhaerens]
MQVVIINGPAGVGKSTVSRILASRWDGAINISGDALRHFAPENVREHLGAGSTYRAGAALVASYVEMGARRVLFDYVFERPESITLFQGQLPLNLSVHVFTLWAPLETVVQREANREGRSRMGDAVVATFEAIQPNLHALGRVIANTVGAEETAQIILEELLGSVSSDDGTDRG